MYLRNKTNARAGEAPAKPRETPCMLANRRLGRRFALTKNIGFPEKEHIYSCIIYSMDLLKLNAKPFGMWKGRC
jgi:hypothetical protein